MALFISLLASLFSVVNPFGAVPVYLAMTPHYTIKERNRTALHTSIYFILILLAFYFAGSFILGFFGISIYALKIAGGMVILSSGMALSGGKYEERKGINKEVRKQALNKEDISFSPMAMPMLSGPGSISLLISLYAEYSSLNSRLTIVAVVITTGILVYAILRTAPYLFKLLGVAGLKAVTKIMGFIVMAIGVQYIITGIMSFVKHY